MMHLNLLIIMILMILIFLTMIYLMLSKKIFKDREKMSPFECGFDPMVKNRLPFSLQFYLIAIIFLIFDVEITLILPYMFLNSMFFFMFYLNMLLILLILLFGLYLEWMEGALKWSK